MTAKRLAEYERLLRRLRADPRLWTGYRIGGLIGRVKARCMPAWDKRAHAYEMRAMNKHMHLTT